MKSRVVCCALLLLVSAAGCHRASSVEKVPPAFRSMPRDAARFSISGSTDSTVNFRPVEARWLKPGMRGLAVDPTQRDALIARLTIQSVDTSGIIAKIDGRVSQVSTTHVVLMVRPAKAWWHDSRFWFGAGSGGAIGAIIVAAGR